MIDPVDQPSPPERPSPAKFLGLRRSEWGIAATSVGLNVLVNGVLPERLHVPASLAAAGIVSGLALHAGSDLDRQGLHPRNAGRGLLFGVGAAAPVTLALGAGLVAGGARRFYRERRITDATPRQAAFEVFVRIPYGTALPEEIIFRGAIGGLLSRYHSQPLAAAISSVLFGLWHVAPTLDRLKTNALVNERPRAQQAAWVAGTVTVTGAAGLLLTWLQVRSKSIIAPWMAHSAANASGYAVSWLAARMASEVDGGDASPPADGDASQRMYP